MIQVATVVGAGLLSGVYAAFSAMVIPALRRLDDKSATAAMIQINRKAERGPFIVIFGSAAVAATGLAITAAPRGNIIELVVAGASLASTIVTVAVNVPLNRRLERDGSTFWNEYSHRWTTANTVRATLAATAVLAAATHWSRT
ncbi:anthrone oxygenase family protein [Arthrobacter sp. TMS2-4]